MKSGFRFIPLVVALFVVLGCQPQTTNKKTKTQLKVNLPASPSMAEPTFVEKYVDGNYTVAGLIRSRGKLLNTEVRVKAYVQSNHACGPLQAPCDPPPHVILVDDLVRPHKRLVVLGGTDTGLSELKVKQVVMLEGRYLQSDPQGLFIRMEGLLLLPPKKVEEEPEPEKKPRRGK
ncbi:MAG TPA: hypothetical protein EYN66_02990 [Myxococcales bacterium]|nr:hypothetical protein [Myxococcales bacterium]